MKDSLSPYEIDNLIKLDKLRSFVELVANGKRPDGTYNYCREALEKKAQQLLQELKEIKQDGLRNLC
jgi:AAA+ ATPase superfamily predicted ATPase